MERKRLVLSGNKLVINLDHPSQAMPNEDDEIALYNAECAAEAQAQPIQLKPEDLLGLCKEQPRKTARRILFDYADLT